MNGYSVNRLKVAARIAALCVIVLSLLVIIGYVFQIERIIRLRHDLRGMSLVTSVGIFDLAVGLLAESWHRGRITSVAAWLGVVLGVGSLAVQAAWGVDALSPHLAALLGFTQQNLARTSAATALSIVLLGLSMLARSRSVIANAAAMIVALIAGFALRGYAYGVADLSALPLFASMAFHTAASLLTLAAVSIVGRPESNWSAVIGSDTESGAATRRQLLLLALLPIGGWLLLRAMGSHAVGPAAAMAVLVILTAASLALLILRDGYRLDQLDTERRAKLTIYHGLHAEMETRLADQAQELLRRSEHHAKTEAALYKSQRLEALSQLTGGIAHEFNNLLQAISGNMDLMTKRLATDHPAYAFVQRARGATQKGAKLSNQLLAFSRIQRLNIRAVEIDASIQNAHSMLAAALGSRVTLRFDLLAHEWAKADDDQLQLALLNLALNSRDAMPASGVLTIESRARAVTLPGADEPSPCIVVSLTDNGSGMSPEIAAHAMEPFFTTKPAGTSSGLGLAQVHGFVRQCGGDLHIMSEPGVGTTIELVFPVADPPTLVVSDAAAGDDGKFTNVACPGQVILVIEDDEDVRGVMVGELKVAGYQVVEANEGSKGVKLLDTLTPSAAVIDFLMPGLNGAETARLARAKHPGLPIVFVSGHYETVALAEFGNAAILHKPFDLADFRRTVADAVA